MSPTLAIAPKQPTRTGWALLLTSVAFFMVTLDSLVVVTALPAIHRELGGQVSTLEWAVNAYLLVFAAGSSPRRASASASAADGCTPPASPCSAWPRRPVPWRPAQHFS